MATFVLSLHSSPSLLTSAQALFRFASAALKLGHRIDCVFFYQDAVYHAQTGLSLPSDQLNLGELWQGLKDHNISLFVCSTAAEQRGVEVDTSRFNDAGLAEFAMKTSKADRWVQFK
ncbi:tRNA 5-methylaminomethyl-2-thiouridine synthase TusD [Pseudoalteromonas luteoviolacea B = ATCC 29581]|nr:tRNA 5-methylaminomethyl-2-thiouridine synthase TusD [Pseudoalteromonas luteoviolacea B = ATCC 29581]